MNHKSVFIYHSHSEVGKKNQYVAIADHTAVNPDELSINRGDSLIHMNKDPSGWTRVKRDGTAERGWVPSSYLQQVRHYCYHRSTFVFTNVHVQI